jgi:hypothetical protein
LHSQVESDFGFPESLLRRFLDVDLLTGRAKADDRCSFDVEADDNNDVVPAAFTPPPTPPALPPALLLD